MSHSNTSLDLTTVETEDHDKLANKIESFYKNDSAVKSQLAWNWERNHLMLDGKQWIVFDGERETGGIWRRLRVSKANEYIPRPVTNYVFDVYQTLKSYLLRTKPRSNVRPNTHKHADKTAAKLAELVLECNYERLKESKNYEYAAATMLCYGTVFKKSYWDTTALSMARVPMMQQVPTIDPTTGMETMKEEQATNPETGEPMFEEIPLGDVNTSVIEPYRFTIDPLASDLHDAKWVMEYAIQPLEWIKEMYGKEEEGFTGRAEELKEERALSSSMRRFFNLKTSSGIRTTGFTTGESSSGGDDSVENAAVVKEYYERPSRKHPKGRLIVVANGITLFSGDTPCTGTEQGDWHPYSECRWEVFPGRFWGRSPIDDAVEIQKHINSLDAVIILTRKTMAIPQKLIPINSGIKPGSWTGRPGQEVRYRDSGGAPPSTIPASGVHAQVFQEREQRVEDMKNIPGAVDILKGDRPPGVTAASALNMLYEVGTGKLFPVLNRWKDFIESDQKKQLHLVASKYREPRPDFIKRLRSKNKSFSEQEIGQFIGADLHDNCNVVVEAGSNIPKLQSAEQGKLLELAQTGTLSLEVPENRMKFLERMGVDGFANEISPDIKRAEWENDLMDGIVENPDNAQAAMVLDVDDHALHNETHKRRMKEPSFMALDIQVQQAYMMHIGEHEEKLAEQQQQQMMQAAMTGQPPQPPQDANTPQQIQAAGSGVSEDTKEQLFGPTKVPGGGT